MKSNFYTGCIMVFCMACSSPQNQISNTQLPALDAAENLMFQTFEDGDSATFRSLCGPEYFTINVDGVSQHLEEAIALVPRFKGSHSVRSAQQQRVFDNLVLRNGHATFYMGQTPVAEVLYTTGWVHRDGKWQFVHWQGTATGMSLKQ